MIPSGAGYDKIACMTSEKYRIVFMGSPAFSLPILQGLANCDLFDIVGVVTQPDRPKGRGRKLVPPPVKELADALQLPVIQPVYLRKNEAAKQQLTEWAPDLMVVAAFGQILKPDVLDLPKHGCINVHTSLLPRWRGASPIQSAILHGDEITGVTIMKLDAGMDTGPLLSQRSFEIPETMVAGELETVLSEMGASLLLETLPSYLAGEIIPVAQDESKATKAPLLKKQEGKLDFREPCKILIQKVRAYNPWPSAFFDFHGQNLKVLKATSLQDNQTEVGVHSSVDNYPAVGCLDGWVILREVQLAGKKAMAGDVFLRGYQDRWFSG